MGFRHRHSPYRTCKSPESSVAPPISASLPSYVAGSLIDPRFDFDSCGVGFVAKLSAEPSHQVLRHALTALSRLEHRGAVAADGKSSDGVGVTTSIPRSFLLRETRQALASDDPL